MFDIDFFGFLFFASRVFIAFMAHGEVGFEQMTFPLIVRNLQNEPEQAIKTNFPVILRTTLGKIKFVLIIQDKSANKSEWSLTSQHPQGTRAYTGLCS